MNRIIGQKEIPDLLINGNLVDTAMDFNVSTQNGAIEIQIVLAVIPLSLKRQILNDEIINTELSITEPIRLLDGSDDTHHWAFTIRSVTMYYALDVNGEPCRYYLTFRNYNNG